MNGSALVVKADSVEEVRALLEGDIYAKSGVWDVSKAQILPVSGRPFAILMTHWLFPRGRIRE
jgi:hypothetical protein